MKIRFSLHPNRDKLKKILEANPYRQIDYDKIIYELLEVADG